MKARGLCPANTHPLNLPCPALSRYAYALYDLVIDSLNYPCVYTYMSSISPLNLSRNILFLFIDIIIVNYKLLANSCYITFS